MVMIKCLPQNFTFFLLFWSVLLYHITSSLKICGPYYWLRSRRNTLFLHSIVSFLHTFFLSFTIFGFVSQRITKSIFIFLYCTEIKVVSMRIITYIASISNNIRICRSINDCIHIRSQRALLVQICLYEYKMYNNLIDYIWYWKLRKTKLVFERILKSNIIYFEVVFIAL